MGCEGHAERQGKGVKGVLRGDGEGIALIGEGVGLRGKGEIHGAVGGIVEFRLAVMRRKQERMERKQPP